VAFVAFVAFVALVALTAFVALVAVPVKLAVIVLALKLPPESLRTTVDAPLAEAAVVRALSIVPDAMFEALIALKEAPLPTNPLAVITSAEKSPAASLNTIVDAPLADDAVVLAFAIVPLDILLALMSVNPAPFPLYAPETVTKVPTFAAKEPLESLATMVDAPLEEEAVVRAFAMVPAEILDALIAVRVNPDPMKFVAVALPVALRFPVADTFPVAVTLPVAAKLAVERFKAATLPV